jgi:hypothetical protein
LGALAVTGSVFLVVVSIDPWLFLDFLIGDSSLASGPGQSDGDGNYVHTEGVPTGQGG